MGVQRRLFGVLAAVVLVGGCGGGSHESHRSSSSTASTAGAAGTATTADTAGTAGAPRTVDVTMKDIAFDPPSVTVTAGETVTFVFRNEGTIRHDAFLGDEAAQEKHEKDMQKAGSHHHHGSDAITVDPGETGSLTHTFKAGDVLIIGCHEAGHWAAGMKLAVAIS